MSIKIFRRNRVELLSLPKQSTVFPFIINKPVLSGNEYNLLGRINLDLVPNKELESFLVFQTTVYDRNPQNRLKIRYEIEISGGSNSILTSTEDYIIEPGSLYNKYRIFISDIYDHNNLLVSVYATNETEILYSFLPNMVDLVYLDKKEV